MTRRRSLAHGRASRLGLVLLLVGLILGFLLLLLLVLLPLVGLVDDAEVPEHEVRDEDLLEQRSTRVGELDVTEPVDGSLDVDGVPGKVGRRSQCSLRGRSSRRGGTLRLEQGRSR